MKQWYFNPAKSADIHSPSNYSLVPKDLSKESYQYKLYAILADDTGNNQPIINQSQLNIDFIRSVNEGTNIGMVILNKQFLKKENWFNKLMNKIITYI